MVPSAGPRAWSGGQPACYAARVSAPAAAARPRAWIVPAIVLALSILVRVAYVVELWNTPGAVQHTWEESDLWWNDQWGRALAAGDWVMDRRFHPYLRWQQELATEAVTRHPEVAERLRAEGADDPAHELHDRWLGGKIFYQEPLYAYLIGVTYRLLGPDPRLVYAWQLVLGVLANLLVWIVARRHFGDTVGAVAALLVTASGVVLHYELTLLRDALVGFMAIALVALADRALVEPPRAGRWFALGLGFGLAILLKSIFLPWGVGVLGVAAWQHRRLPTTLVASAGTMALGTALALAPAVARNLAVGVPPLALSGVAPWAFAQANVVDFQPARGMFLSHRIADIMAVSQGSLPAAVRATLATHDGAASVLRLLGEKALVALNWYELPNNTNFYYYRLQAPVLGLLPVGFGMLAPLALPGLVLGLGARRPAWPLYLMASVQAAALLLFFTLSRYRAPLVLTLAPFGALTLVSLARWASARRLLPVAVTLAGAALVASLVWRPLPPGQPLVPMQEYAVGYRLYYQPLALEAAKAHDWPRVVRIFGDSLRIAPPVLDELAAGRPARNRNEAELADLFSRVYVAYASALAWTGDAELAAREQARATALAAAAGANAGGH
jgi:hypothetical protein